MSSYVQCPHWRNVFLPALISVNKHAHLFFIPFLAWFPPSFWWWEKPKGFSRTFVLFRFPFLKYLIHHSSHTRSLLFSSLIQVLVLALSTRTRFLSVGRVSSSSCWHEVQQQKLSPERVSTEPDAYEFNKPLSPVLSADSYCLWELIKLSSTHPFVNWDRWNLIEFTYQSSVSVSRTSGTSRLLNLFGKR